MDGRRDKVATCVVQHALLGSAAAVAQGTATAFHPHLPCSLVWRAALVVQVLYICKSIQQNLILS